VKTLKREIGSVITLEIKIKMAVKPPTSPKIAKTV
jgi:hypothetical protein